MGAELLDQTTDNQTADGTEGNEGAQSSTPDVSLSQIMGEGAEPEGNPEGDKSGENANKGSEKLPAWMSQLPDDLKKNDETVKALSKFQKIGDVANSYVELSKKLGNTLSVPGEDATDEEKASFYEKLGVPKSADDYTFSKDMGASAKAYNEMAFNAHLSNDQAASIFQSTESFGKAYLENVREAQGRQLKETENALKKEYGSNFPVKMEMCKRGLLAAGGNVAKTLRDSGLSGNPDLVKHFIMFGEMVNESGSINKGSFSQESQSLRDGGTFDIKE